MIWLIAATVWVTVAAGVLLVQSRDIFRCVLGLAVLGSGANLAVLASGRIGSHQPPIVPAGESVLGMSANPLPQALVLTAIVIGFALLCFSLVLALRLIQDSGTDDALALPLDDAQDPKATSRSHGQRP